VPTKIPIFPDKMLIKIAIDPKIRIIIKLPNNVDHSIPGSFPKSIPLGLFSDSRPKHNVNNIIIIPMARMIKL
jgi:hypothetical protein